MTDEKTNGTPNEEIETTSLTIPEQEYENVLRQHIRDDPRKAALAKHQIWMNSIPHEYPMPYVPYRIGVYIRYYNQTKYDNYKYNHTCKYTRFVILSYINAIKQIKYGKILTRCD